MHAHALEVIFTDLPDLLILLLASFAEAHFRLIQDAPSVSAT